MKQPNAFSRFGSWLKSHREWFLILGLLVIAGTLHGWNMFHFPYFENDEATYFSQAWSFLSQGKLAPYTYWYDHAPLGWIFTSGWIALTGSLFKFGFSLDSARVFMMLIHVAIAFLLYMNTKKITKSGWAASIAVLLFSISPVAVYFQRRLLLDNIMTFWVMFSLFFILHAKQRLWFFLGGALFLGIAILTKENAVFFVPVFFALTLSEAHKHQRAFVGFLWLLVTGMVVSLYPLYAIYKQELFPTGTLLGGTNEHVSLLGTLKEQSSRGSGLPFWNNKSDFSYNFGYWLKQDPLFMIIGMAAFFLNGVLGIFHKPSRILFFLTFSILAFLVSGKLVINFYVIPLVPFLAMDIGYILALPTRLRWKWAQVLGWVLSLTVVVGMGYFYGNNFLVREMFSSDETKGQVQAIDWIKQNIQPDAHIAMDYYGNLDLTNSRFAGDLVFTNVDWYWKVDLDPDIRDKKLHDNFRNIDYVLMTPQLFKDTYSTSGPKKLSQKALDNSSQIAYFGQEYKPESSLLNYVFNHPNGNWVAVYKQNSYDEILSGAWQSYKQKFVRDDGRVIDPKDGSTQIRNVGYTLLRAVLENDQETFDKVFSWTNQNMWQDSQAIFANNYGKKGSLETILDTSSASDGDQFITYSLALASKKWPGAGYQEASAKVIRGIWKNDVTIVQDEPYLVAGSWTNQPGRSQYTLNPSSLMPLFYPAFAQIVPEYPWQKIEQNSYSILKQCSGSNLLPPNWCDITGEGLVVPATEIDKHSTDYSYEAFRSLWNLSTDALVNKNPAAQQYLQNMDTFAKTWQDQEKIFSHYTRESGALPEESTDQYAGTIGYFLARDDDKNAQAVYDAKISDQAQNTSNGYSWGDANNIFEQNWIWMNLWLLRGKFDAITF